jgi:hypothetical protein
MEVHHHPDLHHAKKKWKEYLLEFLMIFLAVTLGFFAETIRERISDHHREQDYIAGLITNIQSDTANLDGLISRNELELKGIDTLLQVAKTKFKTVAVQDSIFYFVLQYTFNLHLFQFNDLTLVQLRNAGGYSLIKTSKVADSIALYESKNTAIKLQEKFVIDFYEQATATFRQIFDATLTSKFFLAYESKDKIPANIYVLTSTDQEKMYLLYNNYWTFAGTLTGYTNMLRAHLVYLQEFLQFLKSTYHAT